MSCAGACRAPVVQEKFATRDVSARYNQRVDPAAPPPSQPSPAPVAGPGAIERGLRLVQQVSAALSTGEPLEGLPEAAARIAEALGFHRAAVLVTTDAEPETIYLVANSDETDLTRLPFKLSDYPELASAIRSRRPVFAAEASLAPLPLDTLDIADTADLSEAAAAIQPGSLLVLPLAPEGRAIGCLALRGTRFRPAPDEEELSTLRLAAQVLAVALKSGRLLESLREQTRTVSRAAYEEQRRLRAFEQYRAFFDSTADGVVVVDADLRILHMNRAAEQLTGYAGAGLRNASLLGIVPDAQHAELVEVVNQTASGAHLAGFDFELVTTSGESIVVSASTSTVLVEHGAVVFSFRDVTEARGFEDELRKTSDFLARLIDAAVDGIIAADMSGKIILFNPGAELVFGYKAEEVIGRLHVWQLYSEGVGRQVMAELRSEGWGGPGKLIPSRREIMTRSGELIPVQLAASIIYENQREVATVGIFSDLRERLKIEQRLAEAQEKLLVSEKQALIAELAGTTAHELNQPLTSVMGYSELLLKRCPEGDPNRRALDIILREAERMADIVRKIGKITKYETKAYVGSTTILDLDKSTTG